MDLGKGLSKDGVLAASEEAAKAPTMFHPRERAMYVKERVAEIRTLRALGQNDEQIKQALGPFVEQYPTLFQMAVEPHFDMNQLNVMLGLLDRMAGGMSQHQASVIVGQKLANDYINPVVGKK
jgi:hypothetical protein